MRCSVLIRRMEKIFAIADGLEEKKVNIRTFYLVSEVDICWSTIKDRLQGLKFTWSKFLEELRAKFYLLTIQ